MIIQIKKEIYEKLSDSEKSVVDYINQNEKKIPLLSITNIAEKTFTSTATVSRAIQKCGFQGISELRYMISQQDKDNSEDNSPFLVNEILAKSYRESAQTIDNLRVTSILQAIDFIKKAKRIYLYSRGFTALIAEDFQMCLQVLGYDAIVVSDVIWMNNTNKIIKPDDIVFILSIRNSTKELAESARAAQRTGAKVITCCCKSPTDLEKYSDIVITGHSEQIMDINGLNVYSRIPLLIITRTIIEYLSI